MIKFSRNIDFLQFTAERRIDGDNPAFKIKDRTSALLPQYEYTDWLECGAKLFVPHMRVEDRQGFLYQFSGESCAWYRNHASDDALMILADKNARSITRLDFALNIHGDENFMTDVLSAHQNREIKTRSSKFRVHESLAHGLETLDIGTAKGDSFVTVYNKAIQLDLDELMCRVELKKRRKQAHGLAKAMLTYGIEKAGLSALKRVLDMPTVPAWVEAFNGQKLPPAPRLTRKKTSYRRHLEQTLTGINKHLKTHPQDITWFLLELKHRYEPQIQGDELVIVRKDLH